VRLANYIYVNGQLAVKKDSTGAYFYHNDPAGTPLAITDNSATVVWKSDYEPFGEEVVEIATRKNDRLFIGKERDEETGLYYFGARYMASGLGRFIAVDPVGPVDEKTGKVNGKMLLNPQRLNRYSYAINNPYRYVDINGKWPERIHNRIIEEAFGGGASGYKLPEDVRLIFKLASAHVDKDQSLDGSYMHAMRSPRMTAVEAQEKMNSFVQQKVGEYHEWINKDNPYKALFALGEAMHALMDKTSPSHEGFKVWNGIIPLLNSGTHAAEESYISSERMERTVSELRKFYNENK
jgi:RHS repeat-associated protein